MCTIIRDLCKFFGLCLIPLHPCCNHTLWKTYNHKIKTSYFSLTKTGSNLIIVHFISAESCLKYIARNNNSIFLSLNLYYLIVFFIEEGNFNFWKIREYKSGRGRFVIEVAWVNNMGSKYTQTHSATFSLYNIYYV